MDDFSLLYINVSGRRVRFSRSCRGFRPQATSKLTTARYDMSPRSILPSTSVHRRRSDRGLLWTSVRSHGRATRALLDCMCLHGCVCLQCPSPSPNHRQWMICLSVCAHARRWRSVVGAMHIPPVRAWLRLCALPISAHECSSVCIACVRTSNMYRPVYPSPYSCSIGSSIHIPAHIFVPSGSAPHRLNPSLGPSMHCTSVCSHASSMCTPLLCALHRGR